VTVGSRTWLRARGYARLPEPAAQPAGDAAAAGRATILVGVDGGDRDGRPGPRRRSIRDRGASLGRRGDDRDGYR
jgi:hypothetical protein